MAILIKNACIIDPKNLEEFQVYLVVENSQIREIARGNNGFSIEKSCDEVIDAQGLYLAPGFIDIQNNGVFGNDFTDSQGWINNAQAISHLFQTCTYILPTIITSPAPQVQESIKKILKACWMEPLDKAILGIHLEGPYISKTAGPRGAHNIAHIHRPDIAEYLEWRGIVGPDFLLLITLDPEPKGSEQFMGGVKKRDGSKTIFMAGHSNAQAQDIKNTGRFISGGTHILSAHYRDLDKKNLRYIGEIIANNKFWASFIPCPRHFPDTNVLSSFIRAKGIEKSILVTDAMMAAGMPKGDYQLGDQKVRVEDNAAWLVNKGEDDSETKRLAGSTLLMDQAVSNAVNVFGFSLVEAIRMVTLNPAQLLGLDKEIGSLEPDKKASLILFSFKKGQQLVVRLTMLEGAIVYRHPLY